MHLVQLTSYRVATRPVRPFASLTLFLAAGLLAFLPPARAGENKWTSQGPFSGAVTALATDPQTALPNVTVFAGIDGNGVYRSDDGGESWTEENTGLTDLRVQDLEVVVDIAVEPTAAEPSILYAATNGGGLFRAVIGGGPLAWTPVNGTVPNELGNLHVLSIEVDPNEPNILYAGTNGGGLHRSLDTGATWVEINDGVGQRVVFDVEIPIPIQLDFVINEVHPDPDNSGFGGAGSTPEAGEFIELKGQPLTSFFGTLVFYQAGAPFLDLVTGNCEAAEDFDGNAPGDDTDDAYDEIPVAGTFDTNGLFVLANDASVANADLVTAFDLRDDTVAVALHAGGGFIGFNASTRDLLDVVIYSVGGPFDHCIQPAFGLQVSGLHQTAASFSSSASRTPDGGERVAPQVFLTSPPTPGQLNVEIEHLFAATDLNGVFRTGERRAPAPEWFPINNGLTSDIAFSLAIDGSVPSGCGLLGRSTPYVGTSNAGVFEGTDLCDLVLLEDWVDVSTGLPEKTTIRAMEVAPPLGVVPSMIFAGSEEGRIYRRVEGGTWVEVFNGLEGVMIDAVEVYQREGTQVIFAGSGNEIAGPSPPPDGLGGGVFATVDSGANWFQTGPRVDALSGIFAEDVEIDPVTPTTLYAATFGGGVFQSLDGGATWAERNNGIPTSGLDGISRFALSLALDPSAPATLYAGTDLDGIFKTTNGGANWAAANTGLTSGNFSIHDLEVDPTDSNIVYAATGRLFKSTDGGGSWALSITGFPTNTTILDVEIDPVVPSVLYAATENKGAFKSTDGGASWSDANVGLTDDFIRSLAVDPNNNTTVYAGTDGEGLFKSADGGLNWLPVSEGLGSPFVLSIAVDGMSAPMGGGESQTLYVGTEAGGVFRSTDAGSAWAAFNTGLTNFDVLDLEIDPTDSRIRFAGTNGGGVFDFQEVERVTILPSSGLVTTEAGGIATFTVVLTAAPIADVTLNLDTSNPSEGTVSPTTLLFTPANGLLPQTVTITGVDDGVLDSDQAYVIVTEPLVSSDTRFDGVDPIDVSVINQAQLPQAPGIAVNPVGGLFTDETGAQATFSVVLTSDPTDDVMIPISSSDSGEGTVSTGQLTFTTANAQTPQMVTVTGVNDGVTDGDQAFTVIVGAATSLDSDYNGLDASDVSVTNIDNGVAFNTIAESATLGATGQGTGSGTIINSTNFIGFKFTLAATFDVTNVGGHFVGLGGNTEIFVAIMPLNGGTGFPDTPFNTGNALFSATFNAPATSDEVSVNASVQLPAGDYALLFGSGAFGAAGAAVAPGNDTDIGGPQYFFSTNSGGSYSNGGFNNTRMFVNGNMAGASPLFADGFETGDTMAWSLTSP